jgi:hypothetical protein
MNRLFASLRIGLEGIVGVILLIDVVRAAVSDPLRARLVALADVGLTLLARFAEAAGIGAIALLIALTLLWDAQRLARKLKAEDERLSANDDQPYSHT